MYARGRVQPPKASAASRSATFEPPDLTPISPSSSVFGGGPRVERRSRTPFAIANLTFLPRDPVQTNTCVESAGSEIALPLRRARASQEEASGDRGQPCRFRFFQGRKLYQPYWFHHEKRTEKRTRTGTSEKTVLEEKNREKNSKDPVLFSVLFLPHLFWDSFLCSVFTEKCSALRI